MTDVMNTDDSQNKQAACEEKPNKQKRGRTAQLHLYKTSGNNAYQQKQIGCCL